MEEKIVAVGPQVSEAFLKGVEKVDELVGGTIGPYGMNRIIYRKYRAPLVTNDGVTIARHAYLSDEVQDLGAQTLVEIAMKTNDVAGDGTTTSVVIAAELIRSSLRKVKEASKLSGFGGDKLNPMMMARDIYAQRRIALELLEKQKREVTDLDDVISTSLENLEFGKTLGEMFRQISKDGYVSVDDNWQTKFGIETEVVKGMKFLGTYASPYLATKEGQKEAIWEDSLVLVTNHKMEDPLSLKPLIEEMQKSSHRRLVIIGGYSENTNPFSREFIAGCARVMEAAAQGNTKVIQILAVKAPSLTSEELKDVAVFCDAHFVDKALGETLGDIRMIHLGEAKKVAADENEVNIIGGRGNVTQRLEILKEQVEQEKDSMFKEKLLRRIASLDGSVGVVRVGAPTEQERTYLKYKIEDAVNAAKAAREEGIVEGGGIALYRVAEELGKENVLYDALMAPYKRIRKNAGMDNMEVPPTVVDAYKVVRVALENACSAAAQLITCDGAIAERRKDFVDRLVQRLQNPRDNTDDFRDAENQDLGRGRHVD